MTNQEARNKLNQLGLIYDFSLFEYNGNRDNKSIIICPEHGEFKNNYHYVIKSYNGLVCKECRNEYQQLKIFQNIYGNDFDFKLHLISLIKNLKHNHIDINKIVNDIQYNSTKSIIKLCCKKHGEFNTTYPTLKLKTGCPDCKKENGRGRRIYDLKYIQDIAKYNNCKCISTKYKGLDNRYDFICENNNHFTTTLRMLVNDNKKVWCNCKLCNPKRISKAEDIIADYLNENNIFYITEKRFDDCKSDKNRPLRFDFYLPDYNICIEYDGKHHYEPIKYFGGEIVYERTIVNDVLKNKYCEDNNIKLIRIPYTEKNNICTILNSYFADNQYIIK